MFNGNMGTIIDGKAVDMNEEDYNKFMRYYIGPAGGSGGNQQEASMGTIDATNPQRPLLRDYGWKPPGGSTQQVGQAGLALLGAGTRGIGPMVYSILENQRSEDFTPDKYKTLTDAGRTHYFTDHFGTSDRVRSMSNPSPENSQEDPRLFKYLEQVQPYENMAYYNPRTLAGKDRAYKYSKWAEGRIRDRWRDDMEGMEAQELATKYGLTVPERLANRGPFKVDFSGGY